MMRGALLGFLILWAMPLFAGGVDPLTRWGRAVPCGHIISEAAFFDSWRPQVSDDWMGRRAPTIYDEIPEWNTALARDPKLLCTSRLVFSNVDLETWRGYTLTREIDIRDLIFRLGLSLEMVRADLTQFFRGLLGTGRGIYADLISSNDNVSERRSVAVPLYRIFLENVSHALEAKEDVEFVWADRVRVSSQLYRAASFGPVNLLSHALVHEAFSSHLDIEMLAFMGFTKSAGKSQFFLAIGRRAFDGEVPSTLSLSSNLPRTFPALGR